MNIFHYLNKIVFTAAVLLCASLTMANPIFEKNCANCHGQQLQGGSASSLLDDEWLVDGTFKSLSHIIKNGAKEAGMPAFGAMLSDEDVKGLVYYIKQQRSNKVLAVKREQAQQFRALGYTIDMTTITEIDGTVWAVEPLPNNQLLMTERDGVLWLFDGESNQRVSGTPEVWNRGQGGLLDVAIHPDYEENGWVYLSFSHGLSSGEAMTKIVRGQIENLQWQNEQTIYQAPLDLYKNARNHFGSRMVFKDGYIYFGIGDRSTRHDAQDLSLPNGKVFRVHDDGRVPKDNPFIKNAKALPEIWSYGHRNPQGITLQPETHLVWSSEHGPKGGDEMNSVEAGKNYGWPVITYGVNYSGIPITNLKAKKGMEQPHHYWVPSIAVCGVDFYQGDLFSKWQGDLLVTGLASQSLQLLDIEGTTVRSDRIVFENQGRVRDVRVAPDGSVFVVINEGRRGPGRIVQLTPSI